MIENMLEDYFAIKNSVDKEYCKNGKKASLKE